MCHRCNTFEVTKFVFGCYPGSDHLLWVGPTSSTLFCWWPPTEFWRRNAGTWINREQSQASYTPGEGFVSPSKLSMGVRPTMCLNLEYAQLRGNTWSRSTNQNPDVVIPQWHLCSRRLQIAKGIQPKHRYKADSCFYFVGRILYQAWSKVLYEECHVRECHVRMGSTSFQCDLWSSNANSWSKNHALQLCSLCFAFRWMWLHLIQIMPTYNAL